MQDETRAAQKAHLPSCPGHSIAILALEATHDIRKVSLWLRHSSTLTAEIYTRVDPAEKLATINIVAPPKFGPVDFAHPTSLLQCSRANPKGEQKQLGALNLPALSDSAPHNHVLHISTVL